MKRIVLLKVVLRGGMKVLPFYLFTFLLLLGCQQANDGKCHIEGVVIGEQYEGKRIFLVPNSGPATMETVDSMEITNGKFHFEPDSIQMYKILLDYHYRMGLQPLIIVGEPGTIKVTIDSISHATGTPQNEEDPDREPSQAVSDNAQNDCEYGKRRRQHSGQGYPTACRQLPPDL